MKFFNNKKLLFFVAEDWYFCSHRLPVALAARDAGFDVVIVTRIGLHAEVITNNGFKLIPINIIRSSINPFSEIFIIIKLITIYLKEKPDVIHQVGLKPVLYGSIASLFIPNSFVVNAFGGLGSLFISNNNFIKLFKFFILLIFRFLLNHNDNILILQNTDDKEFLMSNRLIQSSRVRIIRSSGVDLNLFKPKPLPGGQPIVMLASRMLWDKGINEFVLAATQLKSKNVNARFVLVGGVDSENPTSISVSQLDYWNKSGVIEYWGRKENMHQTISLASIVCLPSYREGFPKVLLEAAASSRAIVTTDVPGCREIVQHGKNGFLVPARDTVLLAFYLEKLLLDPKLIIAMGLLSRELVKSEFSDVIVAQKTLDVYAEFFFKKLLF